MSPDGSCAVIVRNDHLHLVSTADDVPFAKLEAPAVACLDIAVKFMPNGHSFLVLWPDGLIDADNSTSLREALTPHGLAW